MKDILKIKMADDNDANAETIGDYLRALLETLWRESEGFSGKRPFGNSGWEYEVYEALAKYGVVQADIDEHGYVCDVDIKECDELIIKAIKGLK